MMMVVAESFPTDPVWSAHCPYLQFSIPYFQNEACSGSIEMLNQCAARIAQFLALVASKPRRLPPE
jgi:hypothetical protein